jgi:hypothetical protein
MSKDKGFKKYYLECVCGHDGHRLVFTLDPDEEFPDVWLDIFLEDTVWYKRWWKALKYALGYKSAYGHFGSWGIHPNDIPKMRAMLTDFNKAYKKSKRSNNKEHSNG